MKTEHIPAQIFATESENGKKDQAASIPSPRIEETRLFGGKRRREYFYE